MKFSMTQLTRLSRILDGGPGGEAGRKEGVKWVVGGMMTLLTGNKVSALTMFTRGVALLERSWRERNPDFDGDFKARVAESIKFYEETHRHPTNRTLHTVGIPMIVGGALGLLVAPSFRPVWLASAGAFSLGWALNILGHSGFEKNKPAFSADPLSFITGPIWDWKQLVEKAEGPFAEFARGLLKLQGKHDSGTPLEPIGSDVPASAAAT